MKMYDLICPSCVLSNKKKEKTPKDMAFYLYIVLACAVVYIGISGYVVQFWIWMFLKLRFIYFVPRRWNISHPVTALLLPSMLSKPAINFSSIAILGAIQISLGRSYNNNKKANCLFFQKNWKIKLIFTLCFLNV